MSKFQQWVCSQAFYDLAQGYRVASIALQAQAAEQYQRLQDGIIAAEMRFREPAPAPTFEGFVPPSLSRYTAAILQFQQATGGAAVYGFVVDGKLGSGGMPLVAGFPPPEEQRRRCQELITMLRRSADLLEQDIGGGSVG